MRTPTPFVLLALTALGATGGPDAGGYAFTDSLEAGGPPHQPLDLSGGTSLPLGDDEGVWVPLDLAFSWYGETPTTAWISANGLLRFDAEDVRAAGSCPDVADWSGVAPYWTDLVPGSVTTATLGQYPHRVFAVEWAGMTGRASGSAVGEAAFQVWLLEASGEAVVVEDDVAFGDPALDEGASAVVGVAGAGAGVAWTCGASPGVQSGTSAWFGVLADRPASPELDLTGLEPTWYGPDTYAGATLLATDVDGNGLSDLLVGAPDADAGTAWLLYDGAASGSLADAPVELVGRTAGDLAGSAFAAGDWDADGMVDLAIGAPASRTGGTEAGAVYLFDAARHLEGEVLLHREADLTLLGNTATLGQTRLGAALLSADVDGDGHDDLLMGAPATGTTSRSRSGALFVAWGATLATATSAPALADVDLRVDGAATADELGEVVQAADLDGDGAAEVVLASPANDTAASSAGRVWILDLAEAAGTIDLATAPATATLLGEGASAQAGWSVVLGDFDANGAADLLAGAPGAALYATGEGVVYLVHDVGDLSGDIPLSSADARIAGLSTGARLGRSLAAGDLDDDGRDDLILGNPDLSPTVSGRTVTGGGAVWVFTTPPTGDVSVEEADHVLLGDRTNGEAGTSLAFVPDWNGDGRGDLAVGSPFASTGSDGIANGVVTVWRTSSDFPDLDGDGFVDVEAGGLDCDDGAADVWPGQGETAGNLLDDDCDGWIDDIVGIRYVEEWWTWDVANDGGVSDPWSTFDFEAALPGDDVTGLYSADGFVLSATGVLTAEEDAWGTVPVGDLGARLLAADEPQVRLSFSQDVEYLALRFLDVDDVLTMEAGGAAGTLFTGVPLDLTVGERARGVFVGLRFAEPVAQVTFTGTLYDGLGIDDVQVVWASLTDRDLDDFTESTGDCDDADPDVNPAATEDFANGRDDDCDGVVDAGSVVSLTDPTAWGALADPLLTVVDFEDLPGSTEVTTWYEDLGVTFGGSPVVVSRVDGAAPRGAQAARLVPSSTAPATASLHFLEAQPALALWLIDARFPVEFAFAAGGVPLYSATFAPTLGEDVDGGEFAGFVFDLPVDEVTLTSAGATDVLGFDDVTFAGLGLDDADGDGLSERDGDCDDADAEVAPDLSETWYDGTDQDCDGNDVDADGDGSSFVVDCDDGAASVHPDASESWYDGVDQDCDGLSDWDADGDGHDAASGGGGDCDDADAAVSPGAAEVVADGIDQDCVPWNEYDADGDGYSAVGGLITGLLGDGDCDDTRTETWPGAPDTWYDGLDDDCGGDDDYDADGDGWSHSDYGGDDCDDRRDDIHPGATGEVCYDGVDQDCDDLDDLGDYDCDGDGFPSDRWTFGTDCDDADPAIYPGAVDAPGDGVDSDCAADSDLDQDRDGYDAQEVGGADCDDGDPDVHPGAVETCGDGHDSTCDGQDDNDCDGDGTEALERGGGDCDDADAAVGPGATDACYDGVDTDCDGGDDDDCDRDGHAAEAMGGDDCDDASPAIHPGLTDWPYDGVDNDCDGEDDYDADGDGAASMFYGGTDCDDGDPAVYLDAPDPCYDGLDADCRFDSDADCDRDGWDTAGLGGTDCDDTDPGIHPTAEDTCGDGADADCDGFDDCLDADGDGALSVDAGGSDCDDEDAAIYPGAVEICYDGVDQDCDGSGAGRDDTDCDGDGHAAVAFGGDDCDDGDASVNPDAIERWYDGHDQDCDGNDTDQDGDGHASATWGGDDCDDRDAGKSPSMPEDGCGSGDEDCDGAYDEDCFPASETGLADSGSPDSGHETGRDTGDTGSASGETGDAPPETGLPDETGQPGDSGSDETGDVETGAPDTGHPSPDTGASEPGEDPRDRRCGCSTDPSSPLSLSIPLLALAATFPRRRHGPRPARTGSRRTHR